MKNPILLLSIAFLPLQDAANEGPDTSSLAAFRFDAEKLDVGRVFHYEHSNVDGSHASRVSLYWSAEDRLESLKWGPGWSQATLVVAGMDWETFSVSTFETFRIEADGTRTPRPRLETVGDELVANVGATELRCRLDRLPWHSYDFDLASLNVSLRFLTDPEGTLIVGIADATQSRGRPELVFKGDVELAYVEDEEREGILCRKYSLDGPGLSDRGGFLWAARSDGSYFVDFELDLPDEPGLTSGKLRLLETGELTPEEWEELVAASVR